MKQIIRLTVNGNVEEKAVQTHHTLLEVLRADYKLFGAREGCGIGMCGACTVLLDGQPMSSCILLAALAEGKEITTIEGLSDPGKLHPIQQAFVDHNAFQCSYCTPGFILSTKSLLAENPTPTAEQVRSYLAGNLCRCGSYYKIEEAVLDAALRLRNLKDNP
ncbi:MAG TPA: (2Fe-2S)-binding protein [Candidatus Binatia bacterium]|jgi:carbon-monoxide dehydrogenase small subunit/isoquinoline 1-oxidoreductase alpha subunit/xanthine dehydrogenase YagT iron-sulfur-binding subunit